MRPQQPHQIDRPDSNATDERPEHIVVKLVTEGKTCAAAMPELRHIFQRRALHAKPVEEQMKPACDHKNKPEIYAPGRENPRG